MQITCIPVRLGAVKGNIFKPQPSDGQFYDYGEGYNLFAAKGNYYDIVIEDMEEGPLKPESYIGKGTGFYMRDIWPAFCRSPWSAWIIVLIMETSFFRL